MIADYEREVRVYLVDTVRLNETDVDKDSPLFSSGMLDSFSMMDLVTHVENQWSFRVRAKEITLENFDTAGKIAAYIQRRLSE